MPDRHAGAGSLAEEVDVSKNVEPGHLFVVAGDLTRIAADHRLVPTDASMYITEGFRPLIGVTNVRELRWDRDERVRQLPGDSSLWIARIGEHASRADPRRCATAIRLFAEGVAATWDFERGLPLLTFPALGTGYGGNWETKGAALEATITEAVDVARRTGVDLCLVCNDQRIYSAAQRLRRRLTSPVDSRLRGGDRLHREAKALARHAHTGNLTFFLGAGASVGAGLSTWGDLLADLGKSAGMSVGDLERLQDLDFRDQATIIQRRFVASAEGAVTAEERLLEFEQAIRKHTSSEQYSLVHGLVATLQSREVVTTNYDTLYEAAVEGSGKKTAVLPFEPVEHGEPWLLKLHGCIDHPDSIVLTRRDYLGVPASHGALFGLVQAMLLTRHMVFVGYSLTDEDFHHLVDEVRRARPEGSSERRMLGSVLTLFDDGFFAQMWSDDVRTIPMEEGVEPTKDKTETTRAARRLAIFLGLVCHEASNTSAFLGDPTFATLLDDEERAVAARLKELSDSLPRGHPVASELSPMLEQFGFRPDRR